MTHAMNEIRRFINKESLYFYLIIFIVVLNIIFSVFLKEISPKAQIGITSKDLIQENILKNPEYLARALAVSFAVFFLIFAGALMDFVMFLRFNPADLKKVFFKKFNISWTLWDVSKAVILFVFFDYSIAIIGGAFFKSVFNISDKGKLFLNLALSEALIIFLVLYFASSKGKINLKTLGINFTKFFKNVFFSVSRYIAAIPVLVLSLLATIFVVKFFNYEPEPQEILKIFFKENNAAALWYLTIFTIFIGPVVEEIFFRGFLYPAAKKNLGPVLGVILTSVLFAGLHGNFAAFLPIFVLGLLLIYVYEKTGSLISSITVHVLHNSAMLSLVFIFKSMK